MRCDKKTAAVSLTVCAVAFIAAVAGFFLLPEKIFVQVIMAGSSPETEKLWFLIIGAVIVALASAMCVFTENSKKWLALETVLAVAFVGCLVYNYIVL